MGSHDAVPLGAPVAPGVWPASDTPGGRPLQASQISPRSRILRLISHERDRSAGRRLRDPGGMESFALNLRTKSARFTTAIAATVLGIALLLVYELVVVSDDLDPALHIGWNLLFIGLSAGILAAGAALWVAQRVKLPLRRLAETMSAMARTGQLQSDFRAAGGGSEVRLIEETFRALTISLEESQRARERSYVEAVGAIVTAADARDHETTGHSFRVSLYAMALARALGIRGDELKAIEWGSLLHDVGKMVVPDEILRKMGPLTAEEWHIMKQHPTWGFDMLAEVSFLQPAALDIIYSHHERWDGKGYPRGIAGAEIPLAARIFAAVDTYDAITSDRPYRRARSHQVALSELQRVAGQQLDPRIVESFGALPEVDLRRLRELCKRVHPGLSLPADLLDSLAEPEPERRADVGA